MRVLRTGVTLGVNFAAGSPLNRGVPVGWEEGFAADYPMCYVKLNIGIISGRLVILLLQLVIEAIEGRHEL